LGRPNSDVLTKSGDLLVEPMPNEGHFEYMRQRAAALKKPAPEPPKPVYAPGSLEYERQQAEKGE
jgi:hypothetical protein